MKKELILQLIYRNLDLPVMRKFKPEIEQGAMCQIREVIAPFSLTWVCTQSGEPHFKQFKQVLVRNMVTRVA